MKLFFIRHAQSVNNALWAETGSNAGRDSDPELTELGVRQAQILAGFLCVGHPLGGSICNGNGDGFGLTHIYSSLMVRAVHTGSIIAQKVGLALHGWEELHERGGIYLHHKETDEIECLPGRDRAYFSKEFPKFVLPEGFIDTGWWDRRPHEEAQACVERSMRFLVGLLEKHGGTDDRVAVVSHGGFYNDFLTHVIRLPERVGLSFAIQNTAITRIDFHEEWTELLYQNRTDHLPVDLLT